MTKATTCLMNGVATSIQAAVGLRDEADARDQKSPVFICIECGEEVRPHRAGASSSAHFEHRARNSQCSLSVPKIDRGQPRSTMRPSSWITTKELAAKTAGGDDYIRAKGEIVKGLALNPDLNPNAPATVVVGKGKRIEARAKLYLKSAITVPTYIKRDINAWELVGSYRAVQYLTDDATIERHRGNRPGEKVAGILFLERTDVTTVNIPVFSFPAPQTRKEIEQSAIAFVTKHYNDLGYNVESRESQNLGYDLWAEKPDSTLQLEVKGADGPHPRFFLTRNERKFADQEPGWRLVIVTNARTTPSLEELTIKQIDGFYNLDPLAWECTLK